MSPKPPADLTGIGELVEFIDGVLPLEDFERQPSLLVRTTDDPLGDPGTFELGVKEIAGHPVPLLLGFVAPDEWRAFGCACLGWAAPLDGTRPSRHPRRERIRSLAMVDREGGEAAVVRWESGRTETLGAGEGRVPDVLRRCLGVPTNPPEVPVLSFFARIWVEAVAAATTAAGAPLPWRKLAGLFPGMENRNPDRLLEMGRSMGRSTGWDEVRWQTVEGQWRLRSIDPELAAWMDDGMFSRWVWPDYDLVDGLAETAGATTARRLGAVLQHWGVW